jgi:hypothetical protein
VDRFSASEWAMKTEDALEIIKFAAAQPQPKYIRASASFYNQLEAFVTYEGANWRRLKREMRKARERAKK